MKLYLYSLAALLLVACSTPQNAAETVFVIQGSYAAALRAELAYSNLPRCGKPTSPKVCSKVDVIKTLQKADDTAWISIKEAQVAVRTPGFSESKVTAAVASAKALTNSFVLITKQLQIGVK